MSWPGPDSLSAQKSLYAFLFFLLYTHSLLLYSLLGSNSPPLAASIIDEVSIYIHKSHNVTVLLYHFVFPTKYRRMVIDNKVDTAIRDICLEIKEVRDTFC